MDAAADGDVTLLKLAELSEEYRVTAKDLSRFGVPESSRNWATFSAICVALDAYGDLICYVLRSPVAPRGAVMAFGYDIAGPGGTGQDVIDHSVVLAPDFRTWIARLEEDGWTEHGLAPGGLAALPDAVRAERERLFKRLNPHSHWAE